MENNTHPYGDVKWTDIENEEEMAKYIAERGAKLYFEPRGFEAGTQWMQVQVVMAASNHFQLFDDIQLTMKDYFNAREWEAIEFCLLQSHEDNVAAETVVDFIVRTLATQRELMEPPLIMRRLRTRLNRLSLLGRHALADVGVKLRANRHRRIVSLLGPRLLPESAPRDSASMTPRG